MTIEQIIQKHYGHIVKNNKRSTFALFTNRDKAETCVINLLTNNYNVKGPEQYGLTGKYIICIDH